MWSFNKILILSVIVILFACKDEDELQENPIDREPPVLKNLVIEFGRYDPSTKLAGDFVFLSNYQKVFLEFAHGLNDPNATKILPTFEYIVKKDAKVYSPCDGLITRLDFRQDSQDYSMLIKNTQNGTWFVNIDHISNITVQEGDQLVAGQLLGNPGNWNDPTSPIPLGRVELMVVDDEAKKYYCPFEVFDPGLKNAFQQKVQDLMSDWETFKNDPALYNQEEMVQAGCPVITLED